MNRTSLIAEQRATDAAPRQRWVSRIVLKKLCLENQRKEGPLPGSCNPQKGSPRIVQTTHPSRTDVPYSIEFLTLFALAQDLIVLRSQCTFSCVAQSGVVQLSTTGNRHVKSTIAITTLGAALALEWGGNTYPRIGYKAPGEEGNCGCQVHRWRGYRRRIRT